MTFPTTSATIARTDAANTFIGVQTFNGNIINGSATAPAFSAYASAIQAVSNATFTKVTFGVEDFDTNNNFATSTFTPTVAGYYQINCQLETDCTVSQARVILALYKNGSILTRLFDNSLTYTAGTSVLVPGSILVNANGTTDYFEIYGVLNGVGTLTFSSASSTVTSRFSASMVRSA
jgi:hypothetical protein